MISYYLSNKDLENSESADQILLNGPKKEEKSDLQKEFEENDLSSTK